MDKINHEFNSIVNNLLCTGCGTCSALCSAGAIRMVLDENKGTYAPKLHESLCINCKVCTKICPGIGLDFKKMNSKIFGFPPKNKILGHIENCYIGYSTDKDIRFNSSSGGVITSLLILALEEKIIDGALVTRMSMNNPLKAESFIARTKEEIISSSKSKYCPAPANTAIKEILDSEEGKFAVVGLPCHIQGIRKAELINKKLAKKIILHLGLFCNHTPNIWATKILLEKFKIKEENILKLDYRGEGWPGYMKITTSYGVKTIQTSRYWDFLGSIIFWPARCLVCSDMLCELADLSFGDAWLPELINDKEGSSIIIARSKESEWFLEKLKISGKVDMYKIHPMKVIYSQRSNFFLRKKNPVIYDKLFNYSPKYDNLIEPDKLDYLLSIFPYICINIFSNRCMRKLLHYIPFRVVSLLNLSYALILNEKAEKDYDKGIYNFKNFEKTN